MDNFNIATGLSNFYFIQINSSDTISNWTIIQDNFPINYVINVLN